MPLGKIIIVYILLNQIEKFGYFLCMYTVKEYDIFFQYFNDVFLVDKCACLAPHNFHLCKKECLQNLTRKSEQVSNPQTSCCAEL